MQQVASLELVDHSRLGDRLVFEPSHGFVNRRIKARALGFHGSNPSPIQQVDHLLVDELDTGPQIAFLSSGFEGALEIVDDSEKVTKNGFSSVSTTRLLLPLHALAIVVEVGEEPNRAFLLFFELTLEVFGASVLRLRRHLFLGLLGEVQRLEIDFFLGRAIGLTRLNRFHRLANRLVRVEIGIGLDV